MQDRAPSFERQLKIRHLVLIRTLARELSLRRTAEALSTSQSAVSRGLAEIETLLGQRLFERTTRSMSPTVAGRSLVWHAQRILGDLGQAEADLRAIARGAAQSLHVGLLWGFSPHLLARAVARFHTAMPDVDLRFHENLASQLFLDLTQDRVDIILSHVDVPHEHGDVAVQLLYEEETALVVRAGPPQAGPPRTRLENMGDMAWLLPPVGTTIRVAIERELLLRARTPPRSVTECIGPHFVAAMLEESDAVAAVPGRTASWMTSQEPGLVQLRLARALPTWPVCAAYRSSVPLSEAARLLLDAMDGGQAPPRGKRRRAPRA